MRTNSNFERDVYLSLLKKIKDEHRVLKDKPGIENYISNRIQVLNQLFGMKK